jgi:hypothetical protein
VSHRHNENGFEQFDRMTGRIAKTVEHEPLLFLLISRLIGRFVCSNRAKATCCWQVEVNRLRFTLSDRAVLWMKSEGQVKVTMKRTT